MPAPAKSRSGFLRRYPALGLVVAAGALAILLPSALTVPQSGPSTLAEFAPVPGAGDGRSDLSDLGAAQSGGLGFGSASGSGGGVIDEPPQGGAPKQIQPRLKRCVGDPPRQTEDPLSAPCVAFFTGDNFGATSKGVTRDEVTVILWRETQQATDPKIGNVYDCAAPISPEDDQADLPCKAYMKYFNDRYQTYGRKVHFWVAHNTAHAELEDRFKPFASIYQGQPSRKTIVATYLGTSRKAYQSSAPYYIGWWPDIEDQMRMSATFICQKLKGRPAQHAGDLLIRNQTRKFGLWWATKQKRDVLVAELKTQCDLTLDYESQESGATDTRAKAAAFSNAGVTTLISQLGSTELITATTFASQNGYFPEWFFPGGNSQSGIDTNRQGRQPNQAQWANAFGISFDYRRDAIRDQTWYRAFREGCPDCPDPTNAGIAYAHYDQFTLLFWGIQAAGPRLTPENLDRGLHAIPQRGSSDPYKPAAYFAPGNYSFIKDSMAMWWDPSGQPPDATGTGCYRLPNLGRRFRAGDWLAGDDDVKQAGQPCQGDTSFV